MSVFRHFAARHPGWTAFLQRWVVTTFAVLIAAQVVGGIHYESSVGLLIASLMLGALNAFIRPVLVFLSAPLVVLSFGLFIVVINAALLYFVGWLVKSFHVETFWSAVWGALIISIVSLIVNSLTRSGPVRMKIGRPRARKPGDRGPDDGPVIDV